MPEWVVAALAPIAMIVVQAVKGLVNEKYRRFIPVALLVFMPILGGALFWYYGGDPVRGAIEGLFAGGAATGFYEAGKGLLPRAFSSKGWLGGE